MRESEVEYFLEDGQEKLLKRTHYHYDTRGYVCQEDVYDATNKLIYSLSGPDRPGQGSHSCLKPIERLNSDKYI